MKLALILLVLLSGCASIRDDSGMLTVKRDESKGIVSVEFKQPEASKEMSYISVEVPPLGASNATVKASASMGRQYNTAGIRAAFSSMRIWHVAGISMMLGGVALFILRKKFSALSGIHKNAPWIMAGCGVLCAVIGNVVPAYGGWILVISVVIGLCALVYVAWVRKP